MTTGENIARYRKKRRWSQARLARIANLSRSYIAAVEQGKSNPSARTLAIIAAVLGVEVEKLKGE